MRIPDVIGQNEVIIEITDPNPDGFNRIRFCAFWYDAKTPAEGGPPNHVRGQMFHTVLDEFVRELKGRSPDNTASCFNSDLMTISIIDYQEADHGRT